MDYLVEFLTIIAAGHAFPWQSFVPANRNLTFRAVHPETVEEKKTIFLRYANSNHR